MTAPIIDINPATEAVIRSVVPSTAREVSTVIESARQAQPGWASMPFEERARRLTLGGIRLAERAEELAQLVETEMGKPYAEALAECRGFARSLPAKMADARRALDPIALRGGESITTVLRQPQGLVAAITPWNFPVGMPIELIVPALAVGNAVVFKPSELVPQTGAVIFECLAAELPTGVLGLLQGDRDVGTQLVDGDIDMVGFIGSRAAGGDIMSRASRRLTRLLLELGGKDPMLVFADADLSAAAHTAVRESLRNAGQICNSIERIYVESSVAAVFEARLVEEARRWSSAVGHDSARRIGPLVSQQQRAKVDAHVRAAVDAGARLLLGGAVPTGPGFYYPPTVLADVPVDCALATDETFGPVVCISRFDGSDADAIALANRTRYGLCATVYTADMERARRLANQIHCGQVGINRYLGDAAGAPWVGARESGFGFLCGVEGIRQFTVPKSVSEPISREPGTNA